MLLTDKIPDWLKEKVGYQKTGGLTWKDLVNKDLPDRKDGKEFLSQVANWKEASESHRNKARFLIAIIS